MGLVHAGKSQQEKDPKKQYVYLERSEKFFMSALQALGGTDEGTRNRIIENLDVIHAHLDKLRELFPKGKRNRDANNLSFVSNNDYIKGCRDFTLTSDEQKRFDDEKLNFLVLSLSKDDPFGLESILVHTVPDCLSEEIKEINELQQLEARIFSFYQKFQNKESLELVELIKFLEELEEKAEQFENDKDKILFSSVFTQALYLQAQLNRKIAKQLAESDPSYAREVSEKNIRQIIKPIYALANSKFGVEREVDKAVLERLKISYPKAAKLILSGPRFDNSTASENKDTLTDLQSKVRKNSENFFGVESQQLGQADILLNFKTYDIGLEPAAQRQFEKFGQILFNFSIDINDQIEADCVELEKLFYLSTTKPEVRFEDVALQSFNDIDSEQMPDYFGTKTYQVNEFAVVKTSEILNEVSDLGSDEKGRKLTLKPGMKPIDLTDLNINLDKIIDEISSIENLEEVDRNTRNSLIKKIKTLFNTGRFVDYSYQKEIAKELEVFLSLKFDQMPLVKLEELVKVLEGDKPKLDYLLELAIEQGFDLNKKLEEKRDSLINIFYLREVLKKRVSNKSREEVLNYIKENGLNLSNDKALESDYWTNIEGVLLNYATKIEHNNDIQKLKTILDDLLKNDKVNQAFDSKEDQFDKDISSDVIDRLSGKLNLGLTITEKNNYDFSSKITAGKKDGSGNSSGQMDSIIGRYTSMSPVVFAVNTGTKVRNNKTIVNDPNAPTDPKRSVVKDPDNVISFRTTIGTKGQLMTPHDSLLKSLRLVDGTDITSIGLSSYDKHRKVIILENYVGKEVIADFYMDTQSSLEDYQNSDQKIKSYYLNNADKKVHLEKRADLVALIESMKSKLKSPPKGKSKAEVEEDVVTELDSWLRTNFKYDNKQVSYDIYQKFAKDFEKDPSLSVLDALLESGIGDCDVQNALFIHILNNELGIPARLPVGFSAANGVVLSSSGHGWSEVWLEAKRGWTKFDATSVVKVKNDSMDALMQPADGNKGTSKFSFSNLLPKNIGKNESVEILKKTETLSCFMEFVEKNVKISGLTLFSQEEFEVDDLPCDVSKTLGSKYTDKEKPFSIMRLLNIRVNSALEDRDLAKRLDLDVNKFYLRLLNLNYKLHHVKISPSSVKFDYSDNGIEFVNSLLRDLNEEDYLDFFGAFTSFQKFDGKNQFYSTRAISSYIQKGKATPRFREIYFENLKNKANEIEQELQLGVNYSASYYRNRISDLYFILNDTEVSFSLKDFEGEERDRLIQIYSKAYKKILEHLVKNIEVTNGEKEGIYEIVFNSSVKRFLDGGSAEDESFLDPDIYQEMKNIFMEDSKEYYFDKIKNGKTLPAFYYNLIGQASPVIRYEFLNLVTNEDITKLNFLKKDVFSDFRKENYKVDFVDREEMEYFLKDIPAEDIKKLYQIAKPETQMSSFLSSYALGNLEINGRERIELLRSFTPRNRDLLINQSSAKVDWRPFAIKKAFGEDKFSFSEEDDFSVSVLNEGAKDYVNPENIGYLLKRLSSVDVYFNNLMKIEDEAVFKELLMSAIDKGLEIDDLIINLNYYLDKKPGPFLKKMMVEFISKLSKHKSFEEIFSELSNVDKDSPLKARLFYKNFVQLLYKSEIKDFGDLPIEELVKTLGNFKGYSSQMIFNSLAPDLLNAKNSIEKNTKAPTVVLEHKNLSVMLNIMSDSGYINDQYYELFQWVNIDSQKIAKLKNSDEPFAVSQLLSLVRNNMEEGKGLLEAIKYKTSDGRDGQIDIDGLFQQNLKNWEVYLDNKESLSFINDFSLNLAQMLEIYQKIEDEADREEWRKKLSEFYITFKDKLPLSLTQKIPAIFNKYLFSEKNSKEMNSFLEDEISLIVDSQNVEGKEIVFRTLLGQEKSFGRAKNYEFILSLIFKGDNYRAISRVEGKERGPITQLEFALSQTVADLIASTNVDNLLVEEDFQRRSQLSKIPVILSPELKSKTNIILYNENIQSQALLDASLQRIGKEKKVETDYTFNGVLNLPNKLKIRVISESIRNGLISPNIALSLLDDGKFRISELTDKEREDFKVSILIGVAKISMIRSLGETFINKDSGLEVRNYVPPAQFDALTNAEKYKLLREGDLPLDTSYFMNIQKRLRGYGVELSPYYSDLKLKSFTAPINLNDL